MATDGKECYGILQDVIQLYYVGDNRPYFTTLFKCDWFDSIHSVSVHDPYKLVDLNHTKKYPTYDPFVLVSQVTQVCYMSYSMCEIGRKDWRTVLKMKSRPIIDASKEELPFQADENDNPPNLLDIDIKDNVDIGNEQVDDIRDANDEEVVDIYSSSNEADNQGALQFDMDNLSDSDD